MAALIEFYFPDEIISRFGGEEFCIYMPSTPLKEACERLDDFRKVVEAEIIQLPKSDIKSDLQYWGKVAPTLSA